MSTSDHYFVKTNLFEAFWEGKIKSAWLLQVATAIRGAIILAKMSVVPVRRGYWGNKIGSVHTVPAKVSSIIASKHIFDPPGHADLFP